MFITFLQISWYDEKGLINNARYQSFRVNDSVTGVQVFEAVSTISVTPTKHLHNATYRCEAGNTAGKTRPATVRFDVRYSPSVSVTPVRPGGMAREGEKVGFRCQAEANPPPFADKYQWFVDDSLAVGQYGFYFEIANVSRREHNRQVKCSVENELGVASGVRSIQVTCKNKIFVICGL
jgi:hypothetical protein